MCGRNATNRARMTIQVSGQNLLSVKKEVSAQHVARRAGLDLSRFLSMAPAGQGLIYKILSIFNIFTQLAVFLDDKRPCAIHAKIAVV